MNALPCDEVLLLQRAAAHEALPLEDLTPKVVRQLTREQGVDFATAVLYDRLRNAPQHAKFIDRVEAGLSQKPTSLSPVDWTIAIVPGALYQERPELGGDGKIVREAAASLGVRTVIVPLASRASVTENSARLAHFLQEHAGQKLVLVSLSKGGTDLTRALARPDAAKVFGSVVAWTTSVGP